MPSLGTVLHHNKPPYPCSFLTATAVGDCASFLLPERGHCPRQDLINTNLMVLYDEFYGSSSTATQQYN